MRNNIGTHVKKVTLIIPESVDVLDIAYYWKTSIGKVTKTVVIVADDNCKDGNEVVCYSFPQEDGE